jgi:hypothetical protein
VISLESIIFFINIDKYMSINTNVRMVKEEYLAGYEDIYEDIKKTRQIEIKGVPYSYNKTYALPNDSVTKINDLMQNKKTEYYLWRYYDFFETILKIDNLSNNLDYEHICFCFEDLPHVESILINNIWRLGEAWSHTIVCCETNYQFIRSFVAKTNANIRIVQLDSDVVFLHEVNDYLLNKDFLNKFHGKQLFFSNVSSLITSNMEPSDFDTIYYANANANAGTTHDTHLQGFSFYNKDKLIEQLANVDKKNQSYKNTSDYFENKEKYYLDKIPATTFYTSVVESQYIHHEYIANKTIEMFGFSHSIDTSDKEVTFAKVLKYLEELLNIYY